ncbi:MAG: hypothetical protein M0P58_09680 [Bacteroidales bacterium]|nr:hypothetical protein [Bacteroidales bacterium]
MSNLRQKSEANLDAAKLLFDNNLYAPSVHCSYYSSFQGMKFVIKDFFACDYQQQESELFRIKQQKATKSIGIHEYTINKFGTEVKKFSTTEYLYFTRSIKDLRKFRLDSDYKDIAISHEEGRKALVISTDVFSKMKDLFHI